MTRVLPAGAVAALVATAAWTVHPAGGAGAALAAMVTALAVAGAVLAARLAYAGAAGRGWRQRWRALTALSGDAVLQLDARGTVMSAEGGAPSLLRLADGEPAAGRPLTAFLPASAHGVVRGALADALAGFAPSLDIQDGQRHLRLRLTRADGGVLAVLRDVSDVRSLEELLRRAQRLEAVGCFTGGIAHDLSNLLTVIIGRAERLRGHLEGDPRHDLEEVLAASGRAARLTHQLLASCRTTVADPRPLRLDAVIDDLAGLLRRLMGERIRLEVRLGDGGAPVRADQTQIEQLMMNLCINARDACRGHGTITISTAIVTLDAAAAHALPGLAAGEHVRLQVRDDGCGMEAAVRARLFEPLFTTKPPGQGTGLGLAIVAAVVRDCRAHIACASEPGRGACFTIHFPVTEASLAVPVLVGPPAPLEGRGEVVLVAEDQEGVRALIADTLRAQGYRVLAAADGEEALRLAAGHPGRIDLLVSDVMMPGMNGTELARRLTRKRGPLRTLFISVAPLEAFSGSSGIDWPTDLHFLAKPFVPAALADEVGRLLRPPQRRQAGAAGAER